MGVGPRALLEASIELYLTDRVPDNLPMLKTQAETGCHSTAVAWLFAAMNLRLLGPSCAE